MNQIAMLEFSLMCMFLQTATAAASSSSSSLPSLPHSLSSQEPAQHACQQPHATPYCKLYGSVVLHSSGTENPHAPSCTPMAAGSSRPTPSIRCRQSRCQHASRHRYQHGTERSHQDSKS
mmetsp:Transcript_30580/g.78034  ORF Transcript_30580/g.78034 Transcript_30580/m.78034 type:complete len:120 (-) Transcript_30580:5040-5399(-)